MFKFVGKGSGAEVAEMEGSSEPPQHGGMTGGKDGGDPDGGSNQFPPPPSPLPLPSSSSMDFHSSWIYSELNDGGVPKENTALDLHQHQQQHQPADRQFYFSSSEKTVLGGGGGKNGQKLFSPTYSTSSGRTDSSLGDGGAGGSVHSGVKLVAHHKRKSSFTTTIGNQIIYSPLPKLGLGFAGLASRVPQLDLSDIANSSRPLPEGINQDGANESMDTMNTGVNLPAYSEYTRFGTNYRSPSSINGAPSEPATSVSRQGKLGCWCSYAWIFLLLILVIISLVVSNLSVYFLMKDGCQSQINRLERHGSPIHAKDPWNSWATPAGPNLGGGGGDFRLPLDRHIHQPGGGNRPGGSPSGRANVRNGGIIDLESFNPFKNEPSVRTSKTGSDPRTESALAKPSVNEEFLSEGRILPPDPSEGPGVAGIIEIGAEVEAQTATNPSINEAFDIANWIDWSDDRIVISRAKGKSPSKNTRQRSEHASNAAVPISGTGGLIVPSLVKPTKASPNPGGQNWPFPTQPANAGSLIDPHGDPTKPTYIKTFSHIYEEIAEPTNSIVKRNSEPTATTNADISMIGVNPNVGHTAIISNIPAYQALGIPKEGNAPKASHLRASEPKQTGERQNSVRLRVHGGQDTAGYHPDPNDPLSRIDIGKPLNQAANSEQDYYEAAEDSLIDSRKKRSSTGGDLPDDIKPILYRIEWTPYLEPRPEAPSPNQRQNESETGSPPSAGKHLTFDGKILIEFVCQNATDQIVMHGRNLRIMKDTVVLLPSWNISSPITIHQMSYNASQHLLQFKLSENLEAGKHYIFGMKFAGKMGQKKKSGGITYTSYSVKTSDDNDDNERRRSEECRTVKQYLPREGHHPYQHPPLPLP